MYNDNQNENYVTKEVLLPEEENFTYNFLREPQYISWYGVIKHALVCIIVLGAIYFAVDKATDHLTIVNILDKWENFGKTQSDKWNHNTRDLDTAEYLDLLRLEISDIKKDLNGLIKMWKQPKEQAKICDMAKIDEKIKNAIVECGNVDKKIKKALEIYDADKVALFDYAADYAGGEIVSTPDTFPYPTNRIVQLFGFFNMSYASSPNIILNPNTMPGNCYAFYGSKGRIVIKLGKKIPVSSVSMEHSLLVEDSSTAPRDFEVFGLTDPNEDVRTSLGIFTYDIKKHETVQTFPVTFSMFTCNKFEYVELAILNNYGNPHFTCVYRFRVHAK